MVASVHRTVAGTSVCLASPYWRGCSRRPLFFQFIIIYCLSLLSRGPVSLDNALKPWAKRHREREREEKNYQCYYYDQCMTITIILVIHIIFIIIILLTITIVTISSLICSLLYFSQKCSHALILRFIVSHSILFPRDRGRTNVLCRCSLK